MIEVQPQNNHLWFVSAHGSAICSAPFDPTHFAFTANIGASLSEISCMRMHSSQPARDNYSARVRERGRLAS